jgi:MFS family permease
MYGHIGDRAGRRAALIASIALMGASTVAMGLLPTYATAGLLAPVLLVLLRLLQGVSTGGEFVGSIAFLVEHAPRGRQGLWGSLANFGAAIGGALGPGWAG